MSDPGKTIVVGVDGSEASVTAVRWAAGEAVRHHADLHIRHGFAPFTGIAGEGVAVLRDYYGEMVEGAEELLADSVRTAREAGGEGLAVSSVMREDLPSVALIEASRSARTLVLGASGAGGFVGMLAGSTAVEVAAHAHCPVVVVRGRDGGTVPAEGPVVVGVDGSPVSERALAVAFDEACWRQAPLMAVHAWTDDEFTGYYGTIPLVVDWGDVERDEQRLLAEQLAGWQEKYPDVKVERIVVRDRPRRQLLDWSAQAQLVVVGSRGRGGFRGLLLGSTSQALIHHARCPVMIVRPDAP